MKMDERSRMKTSEELMSEAMAILTPLEEKLRKHKADVIGLKATEKILEGRTQRLKELETEIDDLASKWGEFNRVNLKNERVSVEVFQKVNAINKLLKESINGNS